MWLPMPEYAVVDTDGDRGRFPRPVRRAATRLLAGPTLRRVQDQSSQDRNSHHLRSSKYGLAANCCLTSYHMGRPFCTISVKSTSVSPVSISLRAELLRLVAFLGLVSSGVPRFSIPRMKLIQVNRHSVPVHWMHRPTAVPCRGPAASRGHINWLI